MQRNLNYTIVNIQGQQASNACQEIIQTLPEWFGIPESNEQYIQGVASRTCFCAETDGNKVGLISIEELYPDNVNIYWLGIKPEYHRRGIGTGLFQAVLRYCYSKSIKTITVETLSSKLEDPNYLKNL